MLFHVLFWSITSGNRFCCSRSFPRHIVELFYLLHFLYYDHNVFSGILSDSLITTMMCTRVTNWVSVSWSLWPWWHLYSYSYWLTETDLSLHTVYECRLLNIQRWSLLAQKKKSKDKERKVLTANTWMLRQQMMSSKPYGDTRVATSILYIQPMIHIRCEMRVKYPRHN